MTLSKTDRAGSFTISVPAKNSALVDQFPVGTDVQVNQDGNVFRGWVISPPKSVNGISKIVELSGATYTARTQKIIVTESYTNASVSSIVLDVFSKYVPWATVVNVQSCTKLITIRFGDLYLWDVMDQLCQISQYDWFIDENLDVNFFDGATRVNPITLSQALNNYKIGSASFTPDATKLVNKLWVKGGKATSLPFTQAITVSGVIPIPLFYTPLSPDGSGVTVTIGGVAKTVGIQNIDKAGTKDFLLNCAEKLLIPDLTTTGSGTIVYSYQYPIKLLLEDTVSQAKYGLFEDVLKVETDDKILARDQGLQYLAQYSNPVIKGKISPFHGTYKPGELIKITIPDLNIDDFMQIYSVQCDSSGEENWVDRSLVLVSQERDAVSILMDMNSRLAKLEKLTFNDQDGAVENYLAYSDTVVCPVVVDDGLTWFLHQYRLCGTFNCGTGVLI